ncbi:MAG: InlB B-repeat-containing protein, partial [Clostridia bacterium]|nr:InlB B-repeat-containing protein [Clostridia bacterium]
TTPADVEDTYTFEDVEFEADVPEINNPVSKESGYSFIDWVWYSLDGSEEAHGRTAPNTEEPGDTITYDGRTGTKIAKPSTVPASDVLAVAYFKAPGTAEFYYGKDEAGADDATRLYEKNTGENDTAISAPVTDPEIEGYTFAGWFERDEATGQPTGSEVTDFGKYVSGETKKFVAKWEEIPAYANFYANEGTWSTGEEPLKLTGVHAAPITEPTDSDGTLSRAGYTFVGWGDSADATAPVAGLVNYDRNSDANFYAIWEKNQATFDANGGKIDVDGEPKDEVTITEYDEGDDISGQVKDPTWPGHTFEGWFDQDGNEVDPENMPGGDIGVVTAKWSENGKKNINYYDDEGNLIKAVPVPEGAETPELGKDTEGNDIPKDKPGKTFAGWVDADGNPVTLPANMPDEDINVYAKYDVVDYTLSFDPNGGDWGNGDTAVKSETKHYGDAVSKPADPAAPDENHYFAGWSLDGTNVVDVASTMPANNLAYKAVWREIEGDKYTVTYKDSDGTTIETLEAAEGDTVPKPTTKPSKPGYAFTGWKWTDASGKEIDTPVLMPGENIVATATYAPIRKGGSVIVVGTASARDGSAIGEYSGEYGGEYAAPSYSTPEGTVFRPQPTEPAQDYGEAIPQTGSNETAALFALVSAAAAAAYVVFAAKSKKKDDED